MKLHSRSFEEGRRIPGEFAFAVPAATGHVALSANRNPQLEWSDVPDGVRSFALLCHDPDVPSSGEDVNQEGREIPATLPRVDFFHWILLDIPAAERQIAAGSHSDGVTPGGKPGPQRTPGQRHGLNDYTQWFAGDAQMRGAYHGYDGPAPPWNDSIVHHYVFTLYALDVARIVLEGDPTGPAVREALQGHVIADASITGTYTLNPRLAG